jgi:hypothetical protein
MVTELATFLKPCAFGAPQTASGLDQRRQLGEGAVVSQCRTVAFANTAKFRP